MTKEELREMLYQLEKKVFQKRGLLIPHEQGLAMAEACYKLLTTPRPMEEAPRDGTGVMLHSVGGAIRHGHWEEDMGLWVCHGFVWEERRVAGWLPIWTPLEEERKDA